MKKIITLGAMAILLCATSCSTDETVNNEVNNDGKEKIQFAAGDNQVLTSRAGFNKTTKIVARIVSEKRDDSETKCVRTVLSAAEGAQTAEGFSIVSYADGKTRYWDDAHGRHSRLSVYAVAVPNNSDATENAKLKESSLSGADTWSTTNADNNSIEWEVKTSPAYADLENEDLTYSNNIQQLGKKGVYTWDYTDGNYPTFNPSNAVTHKIGENEDGRLYFTQQGKALNEAITDAAGHFDRGQLEFKHALSRVQVNLIKGDGYTTFNVTDMQILGQSVTGTFDIKSATWSNAGTATAIKMAKWNTAATRTDDKTNVATYEAQMLPNYTFANNDANVLQLTVEGNTYYIKNSQLHTALGSNEKTTAMGKRYVFDITVAKNKIQNITATIVDWNDVNADNTNIDNSHLTFSFYNNGTACTDINLYKYMQNLDKIYTDDSYSAPAVAGSAYTEVIGLTADGSTGKYTTSEYYNDNKTAYHFRSTNAGTTLDDGAKTFTMTTGSTDYHWGAPMKTGLTSDKLPYSLTDGYLKSIENGIVAASKESNINLTEVHMMSQLVIKLTSIPLTGQTNDAKVTLAGAKVKLTKLSNSGTVDMGSGLITPGSSITSYPAAADEFVEVSTNDGVYSCTINVIPQTLVRNSGTSDNDYVGITIKTTDNNEYYIVKKLSEIIATSIGSQITNMQEAGAGKYITRWYPGHKYIYTFNITKTEIKNITATIVGWSEVVAGNTDLGLED